MWSLDIQIMLKGYLYDLVLLFHKVWPLTRNRFFKKLSKSKQQNAKYPDFWSLFWGQAPLMLKPTFPIILLSGVSHYATSTLYGMYRRDGKDSHVNNL